MPQIFKALASISVWILWLSGLVMGFSVLVQGILLGHLYSTQVPPMSYFVGFAVALAYALVAAIIMKIRKDLE